jgi:hypothetical protein
VKSFIFWDIRSCSPLKVSRNFGRPLLTASCLAYPSILKMEATSEKSVDFQRTTQRYVPEDRTLQSKLKSLPLFSKNFFPYECISLSSQVFVRNKFDCFNEAQTQVVSYYWRHRMVYLVTWMSRFLLASPDCAMLRIPTPAPRGCIDRDPLQAVHCLCSREHEGCRIS